MAANNQYYDLYRHGSLGTALTDALDDLIGDERIDPQLAMKVLTQYDRVMAETLQEKVKARLTFKGSLDTYRFCDEVWTFLIRNVTLKLDNNSQQVVADKVKIVSCSAKRSDDSSK
ncbi:transcription initiation factor IIA, gamma subunit-domain-containing protein [Cladorrhinum sp. PSN332]|nr:transcription initiation factor IIA, gamma subunit-domain-containing protein [Cladorrhinum sp. PSN332]